MRIRAIFAVGLALAAVAGVAACAPEPPTPPPPTTPPPTTTLPPPTKTTNVGFACTSDSLLLLFTGQAPATVPQSFPYVVKLSVAPLELTTSSGATTITSFQNLSLLIAVPAGATLSGPPTLSGGSNLGAGTPSATVLPTGKVQLLIPGPLTPGSTVTFPTLTFPLLAFGPAGTSLEIKAAGTSNTDPSLTFGIDVVLGGGFTLNDVPQRCYAPFDPVLSSTTITSL